MQSRRRNSLSGLLLGMLALSSCGGSGHSSLGPTLTVGGYVSGVLGSGLRLSYNGAPVPIGRNGAFTAATGVASGTSYTVTISTQPTNPAQTCAVMHGSGTVGTADVTSVRVLCPQAVGTFAYVVTTGDAPLVLGTITVYAINATTGALKLVPGSTVSTGSRVTSFQLVPGSSFAWALNFGDHGQADDGSVYDYSVNPSSGLLSADSGNPFFALSGNADTPPACPGGVGGVGVTDAVTFASSGAFGYASNTAVAGATNTGVWTFTLDSVSGAPSALVSSAPGFCSSSVVTIDPSGQFAYAGGYASTMLDAPGLYAFTIDPTSGALTQVAGGPWMIGNPDTVVTTDPTGRFAYVPDGTSIYAFTINPASGALAAITATPLAVSATVSAIAIEPTGQFAYVSTASGLFTYAIDATNGALSPAGTKVALTNATTLRIDPSGQFLYVAAAAGGSGQQGTYAYTIDPHSGELTAVAGSPFAVGAMSPALMAIAN